MKKIYCVAQPGPWGYHAIALAEDGTPVAQHCSSTTDWARHDLGIGSTWQHDLYDKHYGAGNWELEWVDDVKTHPGYRAALKLNHAMEVSET